MSETPATPTPARRGPRSPRSGARSAVLGAVIAVGIVAAVAFAHTLRSNGTPSSAPATTGAKTTPMSGMAGMGSASATPNGSGMPTGKVMVVRGTSLPAMQTSGAMPVAMAMVPLGDASWDGMNIQARTSAPATFMLFNGTTQELVKPTARDSFHLMVTLSDATTNVAIPYSSVWATITKNGKTIYDERLWPMISRYMGPHYGNNVALPAAGLYHLTLLVSPPVAARHLEYKNLWLTPHRVSMTFRWIPKT